MEELDDKIVEREVEFTDDWFMARKMERTPTFAEAIHWADTHPNWIKVTDRLPEADDLVLVTYQGIAWGEIHNFYYVARYVGGRWVGDGLYDEPEYWMPIVKPKED